MLKLILFDLDGTLLPMNQDEFVKCYFGLLAKKAAPFGYEPKGIVSTLWKGVAAMVANDGSRSNEEVFWEAFAEVYGDERAVNDKPLFDEFYRVEFQGAQNSCGYNPAAAETVHKLKDLGFRVALATNPVFPAVATESRVRWAGLSPDDFEFYTTYENIGLSKPNPAYYAELLQRAKVQPQECLMVGNDVSEDMVAKTLGMNVFLLTDCLINSKNEDISAYPQGSFAECLHYAESLQ